MDKTNKLRLAVGIPSVIIMLPFVVAGMIYKAISTYFWGGFNIAEELGNMLDKKLEEYDGKD